MISLFPKPEARSFGTRATLCAFGVLLAAATGIAQDDAPQTVPAPAVGMEALALYVATEGNDAWDRPLHCAQL